LLSVNAGGGKTTFLRYLQKNMIERKSYIPIFLNASDLEKWKIEDSKSLAKKISEIYKVNVPLREIINFFSHNNGDNFILLLDGLDQIKGQGSNSIKLSPLL
jgi:predicted NACHT family NTPase